MGMGIVTELGMGVRMKIGPREWDGYENSLRTKNGNGKKWELIAWECEGMGM